MNSLSITRLVPGAYLFGLILFLSLLFYSFSFAQSFDSPDIREILTLQDKRSLGENNKLLSYLDSKDPEIVARVIYALANIGDTTTVHLMGDKLLNSNDRDIRSMAAFALGQIPSDASEKFLIDALSIETNAEITAGILNAIGKIGNEHSLEVVIGFKSDVPQVREMQALSIGRFALRKIFNEGSVRKLMELYNGGSAPVQRSIAYALWRTGDKDLISPAADIILQMVRSPDDQTRMWAVNVLGKLQNKTHIGLLSEKFKTESDWRVRVNILNSFLNYKTENSLPDSILIFETLKKASIEENPNVRILSLNLMGRLFAGTEMPASLNNELRSYLENYFTPNIKLPWQETGEAINSFATIVKDEAGEKLLGFYSGTEDYDLKASVIRSFGNFDDGIVYKIVRDSISADVQRYNFLHPNTTGAMIGSEDLAKIYRAFVDMLSSLDKKVDAENRNIMRLIFYEFISSKDPYITSVSLNALLDSIYLDGRGETISIIKFDFNELISPVDGSTRREDDLIKEIFIGYLGEFKDSTSVSLLENELDSENYDIAKAAADALNSITGKEYTFRAKPHSDYDWSFINSMGNKKFINIITEKGNIKLELYPDIAPFTVMNFLKLLNQDYFNGDIFHRVVPNFVIQDGDPTGTGYGGPGYSIRSEFSPLTYTTGTLGMASSGKDTEGSQFFITHSPQPHLDGRYTIFGQVTEGQDVVDRILVGDRILRIEVQ